MTSSSNSSNAPITAPRATAPSAAATRGVASSRRRNSAIPQGDTERDVKGRADHQHVLEADERQQHEAAQRRAGDAPSVFQP